MTGPFVRCYRFPPDITRRRVVRPDFLINSVLLVWTRGLVRFAYRLSGASTRFVTNGILFSSTHYCTILLFDKSILKITRELSNFFKFF